MDSGKLLEKGVTGTWPSGGMLHFLIVKDDFGLCVESALGRGESSEQKQGDLLGGNYRNSSKR